MAELQGMRQFMNIRAPGAAPSPTPLQNYGNLFNAKVAGFKAVQGIGSFASSNAGSLLGGAIGAISNAISAKKQYNRQKKLMALSHQYEQENMDLQNRQQIDFARMKDTYDMQSKEMAGINPAFSEGSLAAPTAAAPSTSATGSPSMANMASLPAFSQMFSQNRLADANADLANAQSLSILKKIDPEVAEIYSRKLLNDASADQNRRMTPALVAQTLENTSLLKTENYVRSRTWFADYRRTMAQTVLLGEQAISEGAKRDEIAASINSMAKNMSVMDSVITKNIADANLAGQIKALTLEQTTNAEFENKVNKLRGAKDVATFRKSRDWQEVKAARQSVSESRSRIETMSRNADVNERNAKSNERNAKSNERNAKTNSMRTFAPNYSVSL